MSQENARDHNILYQECYSWLRKVKHSNIKRERVRLCAQNTKHVVENEINKLMRLKIPWGSAHRKLGRLLAQSMTQEQVLKQLVGKLKEETQARWYLHLTKAPYSREEDMFNEWLKIKGRAVEKWRFQRNETD